MRAALESVKKYFGNKQVNGVEIGVNIGINAKSILSGYPQVNKLYLVDNDSQNTCEEGKKNLEPFSNRIEWIIKDSVDAAQMFPDRIFEFVYIDANHSYKAVCEDIAAWLPKVKDDGIICGHDYQDRDPSKINVIEAVDNWCKGRFKIYSNKNDMDWWVYKKETL